MSYDYNNRQRQAQENDVTRQIAAAEARSHREVNVQQAQTIAAFLPHLKSPDPREKEAALVALSLGTGDPQLVVQLATMYEDEGGTAALARIATSSNEEAAAAARHALMDDSVVQVLRDGGRIVGTGFAVAADLVVTSDYVVAHHGSVSIVTIDRRSLEALVVRIDERAGVAVLRVPEAGLVALNLETGRDDLDMFAPVTMLAFGQDGWYSRAATIQGTARYDNRQQEGPQILVQPASQPGNGGGPVLNRARRVIGMIYAIDRAQRETRLISAETIRRVVGEVLDEG